MAQFLGFGNGQDGDATLSGTFAPVDSTFAGTAGATSGTGATGKSFATDDLVLIHQSRGTGAGNYEINQIASYTSGTGAFTFQIPLANTYADSGASQAQIIQLKQYRNVTISSLVGKAWDGDVGGIIAFLALGKITNNSSITATAKGFRGTSATTNGNGWAGEGTAGAEVNQRTPNGNGGGGAAERTDGASGAGGAGHSGSGTTGQQIADCAPGQGGNSAGSADASTMVFGGGGGEGGNAGPAAGNGGNGSNGGGIIFLMFGEIDGTGTIVTDGTVGGSALPGDPKCGGGGAGGGGAIKLVGKTVGSGQSLSAVGAAGGSASSGGGNGGASSSGRITIEACTNNASANPSAYSSGAALPYCSGGMGIL